MEPNLYMSHPVINFKSVLVGRQIKESVKIVNDESISFAYSFNESLLDLGADGMPILKFSPVSGIIGPNSEQEVEVCFTPSSEKLFNFTLTCNIRKKPTPLKINVKGEGYEIHESVQAEMGDGSTYNILSGKDSQNIIEFGQVQLSEKRVKRFTVINSGKFNFDFVWKGAKRTGVLRVIPDMGTVAKGEKMICEISFMPNSAIAYKNMKLACNIVNGGTYPLSINGSGCKPMLKFSSTEIDFGIHLISKPGIIPVTAVLEITNQDIRDISIDIISPELPWLDITRGLTVISPGESLKLNATFLPREAVIYSEKIQIEINGLSVTDFPIIGEGSEHKIEADQRSINFSALRIGHVSVRTVKITNKSKIPVSFTFVASSLTSLSQIGFSFSNTDEICLRPKGIYSFDIKFQPRRRIQPFSEEILIDSHGTTKTLFIIQGACQGTDVRIENDTLPFGAVVQRSSTTRKIQLQNIGDIGAKFSWVTL
jgi:hydrocephalus-inducing protein